MRLMIITVKVCLAISGWLQSSCALLTTRRDCFRILQVIPGLDHLINLFKFVECLQNLIEKMKSFENSVVFYSRKVWRGEFLCE